MRQRDRFGLPPQCKTRSGAAGPDPAYESYAGQSSQGEMGSANCWRSSGQLKSRHDAAGFTGAGIGDRPGQAHTGLLDGVDVGPAFPIPEPVDRDPGRKDHGLGRMGMSWIVPDRDPNATLATISTSRFCPREGAGGRLPSGRITRASHGNRFGNYLRGPVPQAAEGVPTQLWSTVGRRSPQWGSLGVYRPRPSPIQSIWPR
jgi:hypothetical protein